LPSYNIVNKVSSNYYIVNINDTIDAGELEFYLQKELEEAALNIDFEYGIYDCSSQKMVYGNYCNYLPNKENIKRSDLPKYDDFNYYFGVRFPTRSGYLASEMKLSIIFSALLLVAILFFLYSIYIILRQKRLSEMQKDFINNMTHEFKTPISTIKISADVFLEHPEIINDARLNRYASIIREQNERLNRQVEKVLQLARVEREGLKLKMEAIDLNQLLSNVSSASRLKINKKGGQLKLALNAPTIKINADKLHLTNIINNLLDNALKYCDKQPDIMLSTQEHEGRIYLSVRDNGIGIPAAHQKKVFNKFYRVPTGNVHNVKGFGLGLFYIRRICDAHGWKLFLDSTPGEGTIITISIPTQQAPKRFFNFLPFWRPAAS
ncbi:MAG: HAMP domain-containing sensor histidine kinase, partial [Bacteroidota bacterium]